MEGLSYYELRDGVWVYGSKDWGDKKDKTRDYLKKIWMDNNDAKLEKMEMTHENVAREAIEILEWWWTNYYQVDVPLDPHKKFGQYLLMQYQDSERVAVEDNKADDPGVVARKITDTYCYRQ